MASYRKNYKSARKEAKTFSQKHHECDFVSSQNSLSVAHDSQGFCSVGERILLLQQVEKRRHHWGTPWYTIPNPSDSFSSFSLIIYCLCIFILHGITPKLIICLLSIVTHFLIFQSRKQHIIVDNQELLISVAVHEANIHDSKGAPKVMEKLSYKFPRLAKSLADGGYRGSLAD